MKPEFISVVVTTHDNYSALRVCLNSFLQQSDKRFEIVVAEDGEHAETADVINALRSQSTIPIQHVSQHYEGFRAARARNIGVAASTGDYIIFVDGDCFVLSDFIEKHRKMAQSGCFVSGKRSFLRRKPTQEILASSTPSSPNRLSWFLRALKNDCTRFSEFVSLPDGAWRHKKREDWKKIQTCNLGVWQRDFRLINGFDNRFKGHGLEDSDLVARLIHSGITRKLGDHACLVLHLEHERQQRPDGSPNASLFEKTLSQKATRADDGLDQFL